MRKLLKWGAVAVVLVLAALGGVWGAYMKWGDGPRGDNAITVEDYESAVAHYSSELARGFWPDGYRLRLLMRRGFAYERLDEGEKALADFTAALAIEPKSVWIRMERGSRYEQEKQWGAALGDFEAALKVVPNNVELLDRQARIYDKTLDVDRAIAAYHALRRIAPQYKFAYEREAYNLARKGDVDAAAKVVATIPLHSSYDAEAFTLRAMAYDFVGATELGLADYERALRIAPRDAETFSKRGFSYMALGEHKRAMENFDQAIALDPDVSFAHYGRGQESYLSGNFKAARSDLTKAVEQDQANLYQLIWLTLADIRLGQIDAKAMMEKVEASERYGWPIPIIEFLVGERDETSLRAAAAEDATPADKVDRLCEANYFVGAQALA